MYNLIVKSSQITIYDGGWYEWHLSKDRPRKEIGVPDDAPEIPTFNY
ncbi:hypothetical protein [Tepidibacter mesophilus]|nr:hypothetical protein [Tepidibacter mesophilus]